jgi:Spy/CpxP family protein refolding chaperone
MKRTVIGLAVVLLSVGFFTPLASGDPGTRFEFPPPPHFSESLPGLRPGGPSWGLPAEETREGHPGSGPCWLGFLPALNLEEKQLAKVRALERRLAKAEIPKVAELEVSQIELQEILEREPVNLQAVEAKLKKMEALRTAIQLAHIQTGEEIKALLTPEQKKALENSRRPHPGGPGFHPGGRRMPPSGEPGEGDPPRVGFPGPR